MVLEVCCYEVLSHPPPSTTDGHLLLLLLPPSNQITAREGKKGLSKTKVDDRTNIRPSQRLCIHEIAAFSEPVVLCLYLSLKARFTCMHAMRWDEPQQLC